MNQISIFDGNEKFRITKKLRLIELFAGYGSQALAMDYLGIPYESFFISEWAVKSIEAYRMLHCDDPKDYVAERKLTNDDMRKMLYGRISKDYNSPLGNKAIDKMKHPELANIVNNMLNTNNLGSIVGINAKEHPLTDKDKYQYMCFYSFPCQDLSSAGLGKGMSRDSGTRSGMLWQVERLLNEWNEIGTLPDVLVMENVPEVVGTKNMDAFSEWIQSLDNLGYKSYRKILNATEFGIPQNRQRCFMVSILGDYFYDFPEPIGCDIRLRDVLEKQPDESYYLSDERTRNFVYSQNVQVERERVVTRSAQAEQEAQIDTCGTLLSKTVGKILPDSGKEHQWCDITSTDGAINTITANDFKMPKMIADGDGITLFESEGHGGVKVMNQKSPTLRAEKVSAGVIETK